jgi:hypothetical protein
MRGREVVIEGVEVDLEDFSTRLDGWMVGWLVWLVSWLSFEHFVLQSLSFMKMIIIEAGRSTFSRQVGHFF